MLQETAGELTVVAYTKQPIDAEVCIGRSRCFQCGI
jgi:hypothetical protein